MQDEMEVLTMKKTLKNKWIFKLKNDDSGNMVKHKA